MVSDNREWAERVSVGLWDEKLDPSSIYDEAVRRELEVIFAEHERVVREDCAEIVESTGQIAHVTKEKVSA